MDTRACCVPAGGFGSDFGRVERDLVLQAVREAVEVMMVNEELAKQRALVAATERADAVGELMAMVGELGR